MGVGFHRQEGCTLDFILIQQGDFQDDTHDAFIDGLDNIAQFTEDGPVVAILEKSHIQHHFDLLGAVVDCGFSLVAFDIAIDSAKWKANHGSDLHRAFFQTMGGGDDAGSIDAYSGQFQLAGFSTDLFDICAGCIRLEEHGIQTLVQFGGRWHGGKSNCMHIREGSSGIPPGEAIVHGHNHCMGTLRHWGLA